MHTTHPPLRRLLNSHSRRRRHSPARRRTTGLARETPAQAQSRPILARPPAGPPLLLLPALAERKAAESSLAGPNLLQTTADDGSAACLIMSIEVPASIELAYETWTRFDLPCFMKGTRQIDYFDGGRMTWRVGTLFDQFAWQAQACEVVPFEHITWQNAPGAARPNFGSVRFQAMNAERTRVVVQAGFDMSGLYQWLGSPLPSISQTLERALLRFHDFLAVQTLSEINLLPVS